MPRISKRITTPYRYTFSISLLIFISIMLLMASLYFQSRKDLETKLKEHLVVDKMFLEKAPETLKPYHNLKKNKIIFIESLESPKSLNLDKGVRKLSKKAIKSLRWDTRGITSDMLIITVQTPHGIAIIGEKVDDSNFRSLLMKSLVYLFIIISLIMRAYAFIINKHTANRISRIDDTARHIIKGSLQKRIPSHPNIKDEYSNLSLTLNQMLDTIEKLMQDLRQVNNNIAHDLKTPLNRLRSRIEISLLQERTIEEYCDVLVDSINDIDELLGTFNALLLMGNLESNVRNFQLQTENISTILEELSELYHAVAEEKQHRLLIDIEPLIFLNINKKLFAQAISNLLDNAIKYTPNNGVITLKLNRRGHIAQIVVSDNGPGIPKSERSNVFERFTRLDQSRSLPGTGLGMALVEAILKVHNAGIQLHDNQPGLSAEIKIPAVTTNIQSK